MPVFHVAKSKDYTVMSNHHLRDKRLSLKAKGLLSQILSLPENWDYITAFRTALKWVLYDRIRYLGQAYIHDGKVDFDDRRILHEMHQCYHNGLGGNGDLDSLMNEVNKLPLK